MLPFLVCSLAAIAGQQELCVGYRGSNHPSTKMGTICEPWITRESIVFLESLDLSTMDVIEWGCGSSTLWWIQHAKSVTSIEHDARWFSKISAILGRHPHLGEKWAGHLVMSTRSPNYHTIPESTYDIVVIDGRNRVKCAKSITRDHINPGGMVILDNAERPRYYSISSMFSDWESRIFVNSVDNTTIWLRP